MNKLYMLRHKPSGLYYRPKRHRQGHISEKGKVYHNKPSLKAHYCIGHALYITKTLSNKYKIGIESSERQMRFIPFHPEEWEVIEL